MDHDLGDVDALFVVADEASPSCEPPCDANKPATRTAGYQGLTREELCGLHENAAPALHPPGVARSRMRLACSSSSRRPEIARSTIVSWCRRSQPTTPVVAMAGQPLAEHRHQQIRIRKSIQVR